MSSMSGGSVGNPRSLWPTWLPLCPGPSTCGTAFQHAHTKRQVTVSLGWLRLRIPSTQQVVWALVAYEPDLQRQLILLTNIPITNAQDAETVYTRPSAGRYCLLYTSDAADDYSV